MRNPILVAAAVLLAGCGPSWDPDDPLYDAEGAEDYEDSGYGGYEDEEDDGSDWFADVVVGLILGAADGGDGGGDGGGGDPPGANVARGDLVRGAVPSDPDARGAVVVARRGRQQRFAVRIAGLDPGAPLDVLVADRFDDLLHVASVSADGLGRATFTPQFFPAGVASLRELAGRRVAVRDGAGGILLAGRAPSLRGTGGDRRATRGFRDEGTGVRGRVSMAAVRSAGRQVFRLEARGLPPGAAMELRIPDRDGRMAAAGGGAADDAGRLSLRADSRAGEPLPLGEEWIESLDGRPFEILCGGEVVADGEFPSL